jgi:NAD(P)H-hydrate epimerase
MKSITRLQVRDLDRRAIHEFGVPGIVLMENAGRGTAELLLRLGISGPVHIVCGKGNNGGDGFVIARHLDNHGVTVTIHRCATAQEISGDALVNYQIVSKSGLAIVPFESVPALSAHLAGADWIVDALLGTGLTGAVKPPYDDIIRCINQQPPRILAVDLPSGLDADTGQPLGVSVKAHDTATFVAPKSGFAAPGAAHWTGQVHTLPIGAPRKLLDEYLA